MATPEVALVSMPFSTAYFPAVGLSLLQAQLTRRKIKSSIHYFNMDFMKMVDPQLFLDIANGNPNLTYLPGEWVFAEAVTGKPDPEVDERYWAEVYPQGLRESSLIRRIQAMREAVPGFLQHCVDAVCWADVRVVGFTSVFQQQTASLALARMLKARYPHLLIIFGGGNCEERMGLALLRNHPWIDAVCNGEGDLAFPAFVEKVLQGEPSDQIPGILCRSRLPEFEQMLSQSGRLPRYPVQDMDALPYPDYTDYVTAWGSVQGLVKRESPQLAFESARGCWWGAKSHCTFCGLNGNSLEFRAKSGPRVLEELKYLVERYGHLSMKLSAVDNIIDMRYFREMLPGLRDTNWELDLFYETKSNLRKEQVKLLSECGIRGIQPGIESLSTPVLRLMRKGVTSLQNIQLLKWGRELKVIVFWNILYGFPGEDPAEYERVAAMIPWLTHLDPPRSINPIRLDRFSPYFDDAEAMGIRNVQPFPAYAGVYRHLPPDQVRELAYFFSFDYADGRQTEGYARAMADATKEWQACFCKSQLFFKYDGERLAVWDLRPAGRRPLTLLRGAQRQAYLLCDGVTRLESLSRQLGEPAAMVQEMLAPLLEMGLMLQEGDQYLGLAVQRR